MDFLIHWHPGPVFATVQCQGLHVVVVVSSVRILLPLGERLALEYFVNNEFSLSPRSIMNRVLPNCHWTWPSWAILLTVIHAMVNVPHVTSQC